MLLKTNSKPKFFKVLWNLKKYIKWFLLEFLYSKLLACKLQSSSLRVFKTPEIHLLWSYLLQKQALSCSLQSSNSVQQLNVPGRPVSVFEKDLIMNGLMGSSLELVGNWEKECRKRILMPNNYVQERIYKCSNSLIKDSLRQEQKFCYADTCAGLLMP